MRKHASFVLLAVAALLNAVGVGLVYPPAGLVVAGVELGVGVLFLVPVKE